MGIDLTARVEHWDVLRSYIAEDTLVANLDKSTLAKALTEVICSLLGAGT